MNKQGQSFLGYTLLIIVVAGALITMSIYLMRSVNARLKASQEELNYYRAD